MESFILPMREGTEFVGRTIENAFGAPEIVRLPKAWWDYYDWCVEKLEYDMIEWVKYIDSIRPPDVSIDLHLWRNLWEHECRRYFYDLPCPVSEPPEGYERFVEVIEKEDQRPERQKWEKRQLENSQGALETIEMQNKFWQFFDYLEDIGGDMRKWVHNADRACQKTKNTLSVELMNSLIRYERKNYIECSDMPLFISLKGYPRPSKSGYSKKQNS